MPENIKPWLKFYDPQVSSHLTYPEVPLYHFVRQSALNYPKQPALLFMGKSIRYLWLWRQIERFAAALHALGVRKGDRVAVMLPNCPQAVIAYYSILYINATVVMVNPLYTERELTEQLMDACPKVLLYLDLVGSRVNNIRHQSGVKVFIRTSIRDFLPGPLKILHAMKNKKPVGAAGRTADLNFVALLQEDYPLPVPAACNPRTDVAVLQYTGGTTGVPKGTMLTHYNLVANTLQIKTWNTRCKDGAERVLGILPFFHVYGMTCALNYSMCTGGVLILLPRFDVRATVKAIDRYKPTFFPGAPTVYVAINRFRDIKNYDLKSIKACISGAAALASHVQQTFYTLTDGATLVEGYGLTEAAPVTHCNPLENGNVVGSIGLPLPDTEAKIVDPDHPDRELPPGHVGELLVRGPQVMAGYWLNTKETHHVLRNGWLRTGDLARMDENGYFYIVDRIKDVIISAGYSIYPSEIETVLKKHPCIDEAAVVGMADEYRGEVVKAYIVLHDHAQVATEDILEYCRANLASFKVPRAVEIRKHLPRSDVGKTLKRKLMSS